MKISWQSLWFGLAYFNVALCDLCDSFCKAGSSKHGTVRQVGKYEPSKCNASLWTQSWCSLILMPVPFSWIFCFCFFQHGWYRYWSICDVLHCTVNSCTSLQPLEDNKSLGDCGFTSSTARAQAPATIGLAFRIDGECGFLAQLWEFGNVLGQLEVIAKKVKEVTDTRWFQVVLQLLW